MTTVVPQEKLSWKLTIPLSLLLIGLLVMVWLVMTPPLRMEFKSPIGDILWSFSKILYYVAKWGGVVVFPLVIFAVISASIWGSAIDNKLSGGKGE